MEKNSAMGTAVRAAAIFLLVLVLCSSTTANSERAPDCCLSTKNIKIPRRIVKSHIVQTEASGCLIPATLFITKNEKRLCAPPASRSKWVAKLIEQLQEINKKNKQKGRAQRRGHRGRKVPGH